jgi:hypothetical protein
MGRSKKWKSRQPELYFNPTQILRSILVIPDG